MMEDMISGIAAKIIAIIVMAGIVYRPPWLKGESDAVYNRRLIAVLVCAIILL